MNYIVENLKKYRKRHRVKQSTIANYLKVQQAYYSMIESGKRTLTTDLLVQIAEFFKIDVVDIITYPKVYVEKNSMYILSSTIDEVGEDAMQYLREKDIDTVVMYHNLKELEKRVVKLTEENLEYEKEVIGDKRTKIYNKKMVDLIANQQRVIELQQKTIDSLISEKQISGREYTGSKRKKKNDST